jgi:hypothetical protein
MAISQPRPDILIRSPQGYPIAVVEVRNRQNLSRDVATQLRHNLIDYGLPSRVPYFMLLSQDVGYLWKEAKQENADVPPTYEFPMDNVVSRYWKSDSEKRLYAEALELLILQWLSDLTKGMQKDVEEPEKTLAIAGFNESIKGAAVLAEEEQ